MPTDSEIQLYSPSLQAEMMIRRLLLAFALVTVYLNDVGAKNGGKKIVYGQCSLEILPVALFPFNANSAGADVIKGDITASLSDVEYVTGPYGDKQGSASLLGEFSSYIEIPAKDRLDIRRSITILAHIYPQTGELGPIVNYKPDGHGVQIWTYGVEHGKGILTARFNRRSLQLTNFLKANVLELNRWNFIGASYDHVIGHAQLWHEGKEVSKAYLGQNIELATQFAIRVGALSISGLDEYQGRISCLQFYDESLSERQILAAKEACREVVPLTALSLHLTPESGVVAVNQTLGVLADTGRSKGDIIFKYDFGDGSKVQSKTKNLLIHNYSKGGTYAVQVNASSVCNANSSLVHRKTVKVVENMKDLVLTTTDFTRLEDVSNVTLTLSGGNMFTCSVNFGDGTSRVGINSSLFGISSGSPPKLELVVTHRYSKAGRFEINAYCWNYYSNVSARIEVGVLEEIVDLQVNTIPVVKHGCRVRVKWSISKGSEVVYKAIIENEELVVSKSSDEKRAYAWIDTRNYTDGKYEIIVSASNNLSSPVNVSRVFEIMYAVLPFGIKVEHGNKDVEVNQTMNYSLNVKTTLYKDSNELYRVDYGDGRAVFLTNATYGTFKFSYPGYYLINVTALNTVSRSSANTTVKVEAPVVPLERLSIRAILVGITTENTTFYLHLGKGSDFECNMTFSDGVNIVKDSTVSYQFWKNELKGTFRNITLIFVRQFQNYGNYQIVGTCRNRKTELIVHHEILVKRKLMDGIIIDPIEPHVYGSNITVHWETTHSFPNMVFDVRFLSRKINFRSTGRHYSAVVTRDMYREKGTYYVTVEGKNDAVKLLNKSRMFLIENAITRILVNYSLGKSGRMQGNNELYDRNQMFFPLGTVVVLYPYAKAIDKVGYGFELNGKAVNAHNSSLKLVGLSDGEHVLHITANNSVSNLASSFHIFIEAPVKLANQELLCTSPAVINTVVKIRTAIEKVGTNSCLIVDIDNNTRQIYGKDFCKERHRQVNKATTKYMGDKNNKFVDVQHYYRSPGVRVIRVELVNKVSSSASSCTLEVLNQRCKVPKVMLELLGSSPSTSRVYKRSENIDIKPVLEIFCPESKKTLFHWEIFKYNLRDFEPFKLAQEVEGALRMETLRIRKRVLVLGIYRISVRVQMAEEELKAFVSMATAYIRVVRSPLAAVISGGTFVRRAYGHVTIVNGSRSYDPDVGDASQHEGLTYAFLCRKHSSNASYIFNFTNTASQMSTVNLTASCYGDGQVKLSTNSTLRLVTSQMQEGETYMVTLMIWKGNRTRSTAQIIEIVEGEPPSLEITCIENCNPDGISPTQRVSLRAHCDGTCTGKLSYTWNLYQNLANGRSKEQWILINDVLNASSETTHAAPNIIIKGNTFKGGGVYKIEVSARRENGPRGLAYKVFTVNEAPKHGTCDVTPRAGHVLVTHYTIRCVGWTDRDDPIRYTFMFNEGDNRNTVLYYGEVKEVNDLELPLGKKERNYTLDIVIRISDRLGAASTVKLHVKSQPPHQSEEQLVDELTSITSGSNSVLNNLAKSGKTQHLSLTINSISSLLNAQEEEENAQEKGSSATLKKKRAVLRTGMIEALGQVKPTSLESMNEVNSAILQATKIPEEIEINAQVSASNTIHSLAQLLRSESNEDTEFDSVESNAADLLSTVSNVLSVSSGAAAVGNASGMANSSRDPRDDDGKERAKAKEVSKSLLSVTSTIGDSVLSRKLGYEKPTIIPTPQLRMRLERTSIDDIGGDLSAGNVGGFVLPPSNDLFAGREKTAEFVGTKVLSVAKNVYTWDRSSSDITSPLISLSYTEDNKPLKVSQLKTPISILIRRAKPLPVPKVYSLNTTKSLWNFHNISVKSEDDSFTIELNPLNGNVSLAMYVKRGTYPKLDDYDWITSTEWNVTDSNAKQIRVIPSSSTGTKLFLSNKDLSISSYYVGIRVLDAGRATSYSVEDYSIRVYSSKCLYWNESQDRWKGQGCWGGPMTNSTHLHCYSNHLTSFGGGVFVAPNTIDFRLVFAGFKKAFQTGNVVVLFFVLSLFAVYALLAIWARRTDKRDLTQIIPVFLSPPISSHNYKYEVTITTGSRSNAGTSANVYCIIKGDAGSSDIYGLQDPNNKEFPRRSVKSFVISTPGSLGLIQGIKMWHDCGGKRPSWFLRRVIMRDCQTQEKWYFNADCWLAVDLGDGKPEAFLKPVTEHDLLAFSKLFGDKVRREICDKHLWFSMAFRPPRSPFTRLQRLSCCLSLLCTTMLTSAMFYGAGAEGGTSGDLRIGPIRLNLTSIMIGVQSALIVIPINLLIVALFRNSKTKPIAKEEEFHQKAPVYAQQQFKSGDLRTFNSAQGQSYENQVTVADDEDVLLEFSNTNKDDSWDSEINSNDAKKAHIKDKTSNEPSQKHHCSSCRACLSKIASFKFPFWCVYVAWVLCALSSLTSAAFVIFYSMMWGREKSVTWLSSMLVAFLQDTFVSQPIKVLVLSLLFVLIIRKPAAEEDLSSTAGEVETASCRSSSYGCTICTSMEEDTSSYSSNWLNKTGSPGKSSPWAYKTSKESNHTYAVNGYLNSYGGGGFVIDLDTTVLLDKFTDSWIDRKTRAVIAELNIYFPYVNLVAMVTVVMETPLYGGIFSTLDVLTFILADTETRQATQAVVAEGVACALLVIMAIRMFMAIFHTKRLFFRSFPNLLDLVLVTTGFVIFLLRVMVTNTEDQVLRLMHKYPTSYLDFHSCGVLEQTTTAAFGFLFFIALARFVAFINIFSLIKRSISTIAKSLRDLLNLLIILFILIIAYSHVFVLAFGTQDEDLKEFGSASRALYSFIVSSLSGRTLPNPRILSMPLFFTYYLAMLFLLLNLYRAILANNHQEVTHYYQEKKSQDNIVDLLVETFKHVTGMDNEGFEIERVKSVDMETESELRLRIQLRYFEESQVAMINRHLNGLYADLFCEDVHMFEWLQCVTLQDGSHGIGMEDGIS